jgi:hypothetical protein
MMNDETWEWWSASMQVAGTNLWCYVEIRADSEDDAIERLKCMFRDCVNTLHVGRIE